MKDAHPLKNVIVAIFMHTSKSKVSVLPGRSKDHNEGAKMSFGQMKKKKVGNKCRRSEKSHSFPVAAQVQTLKGAIEEFRGFEEIFFEDLRFCHLVRQYLGKIQILD